MEAARRAVERRLALACRAGALPARARRATLSAGHLAELLRTKGGRVPTTNVPGPCNAYTPTGLRVVVFGPPPA